VPVGLWTAALVGDVRGSPGAGGGGTAAELVPDELVPLDTDPAPAMVESHPPSPGTTVWTVAPTAGTALVTGCRSGTWAPAPATPAVSVGTSP
jgi:hypothetical protein